MAYRIVYGKGTERKTAQAGRRKRRAGAFLLGLILGIWLHPGLRQQAGNLLAALDPPGRIRAMEKLASSLHQGESLGRAIEVFWEDFRIE